MPAPKKKAPSSGAKKKAAPSKSIRKRKGKARRRANTISIRGARQNNLKGIDLDLELGNFHVITGPSGSGKSSLAFQTIYAEGQRRYVETFSPYMRQFFDRMDKPKVDRIDGIPPAIAIEQANKVRSTRSTVGTITEINDYLKLFFPHVAKGYCPETGEEVEPDTPGTVTGKAIPLFGKRPALVTFPIPVPEKTKPAEFFDFLKQQGYLRVWIYRELYRTDDPDAYPKKSLPAVVDVIQDRVAPGRRTRFLEAVEAAMTYGKGRVALIDPESGERHAFSRGWHCAASDIELRPPTPGLFSFNNPLGACPVCRGFGRVIGIELLRALPDQSLSIEKGVVKAFQGERGSECQADLERHASARGIPLDEPFEELGKDDQDWILHGESDDPEEAWQNDAWYGVSGFFKWMESKAYKMHVRVFLSRFRSYTTCNTCRGGRLQPEALQYKVLGMTLPELWAMPVCDLLPFFESLTIPKNDNTADLLHSEITGRLGYLMRVGLGYLNLDRSTKTLSGGEVERVNLTTCLGASLTNTLFVLDEPSVGLHPRDIERLIEVMTQLRDKGNTLVVVEHEEAVIRAADNLVDIGPGRGEGGGELIFSGKPSQVHNGKAKNSLTAAYLNGTKRIPVPEKRRKFKRSLKLKGASQHNLDKVDAVVPLGVFCCVTGVSGSGKSTLVHSVLYENLLRAKGESSDSAPGRLRSLTGHQHVDEVVMVDQSPLARTPRSTPAVYTGVFEHIRKLFAETPDAKTQGLTMGFFSFNSGAGRCDRCWGNGFEKVEMQFLSDIFVVCPECEGRRYQTGTLEFQLGGMSIHEVLSMTVTQALSFFHELEGGGRKAQKITGSLQILVDVGLGYLRLGQPLNTLSGGESQRLKLVGHLIEQGPATVKTNKGEKPAKNAATNLLIFDEPTTGLHFDDVARLLEVFQRLVDAGNSVLVIEHNLEVIKCADHVIDLGPEAGAAGGQVIATGTPEEIAKSNTHTGIHLANLLAHQSRRASLRAAEASPTKKRALSAPNTIRLRGAREHNLKNISLDIPRDEFVVVTGLSGSGKSTLAFDIIFAEGQRRFLDSMSPYARQFAEQMERPDIDHISGLPPTVAIEQRVSRGGGKSTVATVTEVYHFLRLLFAKVGTQYSPFSIPQKPVIKQSVSSIVTRVSEAAKKGAVSILAPLIKGRKGFHTDVAAWAQRNGYEMLLVDKQFKPSANFQKLERFKEHDIDVVIRQIDKRTGAKELRQWIETALRIGKGSAKVLDAKKKFHTLSTTMTCPDTGHSFEDLDPRLFSFNSPHGFCPNCRGYGRVARRPSYRNEQDTGESVLESELREEMRRARADPEEHIECPSCEGARINEIARAVRVNDKYTIHDIVGLPVTGARALVEILEFTGNEKTIARDILVEISQRLRFMEEVGLGYLSLDRSANTLSGGEGQRIRLASQLGSNLTGVLYVLDEPTIGLHPRDNAQLLTTLTALKGKGNSLLVVEHDEDTMRHADHILDLGPGAGMFGGKVVASGTLRQLQKSKTSITGQQLKAPLAHPLRGERRKLPAKASKTGWIKLKGAAANNLKNFAVQIPLGRLTVISGVSGSGKSSLMRSVLLPAVQATISKTRTKKNAKKKNVWKSISGLETIGAVYEVDQSPIGKTSRSTPSTYVKLFDEIRKLFSGVPEARMRGYTASRFSFNTEGGRCETCRGNGRIKLEMNFLPTSYVLCEECKGLRYNDSTLEVTYHEKNIGEVMKLTIDEATEFFKTNPKIHRTLKLLSDTGLGYLQLGQPSPTLSGGEAQRIKLITQLTKGVARSANAKLKGNLKAGGNLYLIEEPTIGLHVADVRKLIEVLHRLVDDGHTVVVIEHNLDLIAEADYLIDIGPEAGANGGTIVAAGPPEEVAKTKESATAKFLGTVLKTIG